MAQSANSRLRTNSSENLDETFPRPAAHSLGFGLPNGKPNLASGKHSVEGETSQFWGIYLHAHRVSFSLDWSQEKACKLPLESHKSWNLWLDSLQVCFWKNDWSPPSEPGSNCRSWSWLSKSLYQPSTAPLKPRFRRVVDLRQDSQRDTKSNPTIGGFSQNGEESPKNEWCPVGATGGILISGPTWPSWAAGWLAASPASPASLGLGLPIGFDLAVQGCSGLISGECWACRPRSYIMRGVFVFSARQRADIQDAVGRVSG